MLTYEVSLGPVLNRLGPLLGGGGCHPELVAARPAGSLPAQDTLVHPVLTLVPAGLVPPGLVGQCLPGPLLPRKTHLAERVSRLSAHGKAPSADFPATMKL